jgi:hypothetical protein
VFDRSYHFISFLENDVNVAFFQSGSGGTKIAPDGGRKTTPTTGDWEKQIFTV